MAKKSSPDSPPKVVSIHRFEIGLNVLIQLLVVAAIVLMANYVSFRHFKRWDFSRDQKYALSSQTLSRIKSLPKWEQLADSRRYLVGAQEVQEMFFLRDQN